MNNNIEEFGLFCPKKELKEWRENNFYRYKKVYTKFYVTNIYQELTCDKIPRFPIGKAIRDKY